MNLIRVSWDSPPLAPAKQAQAGTWGLAQGPNPVIPFISAGHCTAYLLPGHHRSRPPPCRLPCRRAARRHRYLHSFLLFDHHHLRLRCTSSVRNSPLPRAVNALVHPCGTYPHLTVPLVVACALLAQRMLLQISYLHHVFPLLLSPHLLLHSCHRIHQHLPRTRARQSFSSWEFLLLLARLVRQTEPFFWDKLRLPLSCQTTLTRFQVWSSRAI